MAHEFRQLYRHLGPRRRVQFLMLLGLMMFGALAELLTLGAVLPFLALMADPNQIAEFAKVNLLLETLGWTGPANIRVAMTVIFIAAAIIAAMVRLTLNWATNRFVFALGYDLSVEVYRRTLYQPYAFHVGKNTSEIVAGINKVQIIISSVLLPSMQALVSAIMATAILMMLFFIDAGTAAAAGLSFAVTYLAVTALFKRKLRRNSQIISSAQGQRIQAVQEGLGGIRDVLLDGSQEVYVRRFKVVDRALRNTQAVNNLVGTAPKFIIEMIGITIIASLACHLSLQPGGLVVALPVLGALALGAQRLIPMLQTVYQGWTKVAGNRAVILDVVEILDYRVAPEYSTTAKVPDIAFDQTIHLEDIRFAYRDDAPVLDGFDLEIRKGMRVGFVGKTGSGKSTALDLVMGLLSPTSGRMVVDGVMIDAANRRGWQAHIAHVPQAIFLSDATIAENIAFAVPVEHIDYERVRRVAQQAQIAEFVEALPLGYQTVVGERGVRLSGGQRQRIGIARALYKPADILILDEATSALDEDTEHAVMRCIDSLSRDLTVFIIAHRMSTLRGCDLVVEIQNGRIARRGSYEQMTPQPLAHSFFPSAGDT